MLAPELTLPLGRQGKGVLIPGLPGLEVCRTCEIVACVPLYVPTAWELAAAGESLAQAELLCLVRPRCVSPSRDGFHPVPQRSGSRTSWQLWASKRRLGRLGLGREQGGEGSTLWVHFSLRCAPAAGLLQAFTHGLRGITGAVRKSTRLSPRNVNVPLNSRLCLQSGTEMGSTGKQHTGSPWAV